jgi:hypothetical protein
METGENMRKPLTHEQQVALEGEEAFRRGAPLIGNRYVEGTNDHNLWKLGWLNANHKHSNNKQK